MIDKFKIQHNVIHKVTKNPIVVKDYDEIFMDLNLELFIVKPTCKGTYTLENISNDYELRKPIIL